MVVDREVDKSLVPSTPDEMRDELACEVPVAAGPLYVRDAILRESNIAHQESA